MGKAARYNYTGTTITLMCTGMCMCGVFVLPNLIACIVSGTGVDKRPF